MTPGMAGSDRNGSLAVCMRSASSSYTGRNRKFHPGGFMRSILFLPLTALVAVVAGCGSEVREQATASLPHRDLTLVSPTSGVKVASPVEMQQPRIQRRTVPPSHWAARLVPALRSSPPEPKVRLAAVAVPAPVLAVPPPVAQPASSAPNNDRELLPGKTVTLIPASSGPSAGSEPADELPAAHGRTIVARGGGRCGGRGRGPGIGIAAAPRPDFR